MSPAEIFALTKAVKDAVKKNARAELSEGNHDVDFIVHVSGSLTVGADYDEHCVAEAEPWGLLAVALSKLNGVTVESITREFLKNTLDTTPIKKQATAAMKKIKGTTLKTFNGKVTAKIDVDPVRGFPIGQ